MDDTPESVLEAAVDHTEHLHHLDQQNTVHDVPLDEPDHPQPTKDQQQQQQSHTDDTLKHQPPPATHSPTKPPSPPPAATAPPHSDPIALVDSADLAARIAAAETTDALVDVLKPSLSWPYTPEQEAAIRRARTYIPDKAVYAGFFVQSINEWKIAQQRVIVVTSSAYYRVKYDTKSGKVDRYNKTPLSKLRALEKTAKGLRVYLTEQDGQSGPKKWASWAKGAITGNKPKEDEFSHAREYLPVPLAKTVPTQTEVIDVLAALLRKACELAADVTSAPSLLTTVERKQIISDRKAAELAEKQRVEREAAEEELRKVIEEATSSRDARVLAAPLRRCRRAVEASAELMEEGEALKATLEEELRERLERERLERERLEREAATDELNGAIETATDSRQTAVLSKAIRRGRKAVDVSEELIRRAVALQQEIEEEKRAAAEEAAAAERARRAEEAERKRAAAEAEARSKAEAAASASALAAGD